MTSTLPDSPADLLLRMLAIESVTPAVSQNRQAELPLAQELAAMATGWGLQVEWLEANDHSGPLAPNLLVYAPSDAVKQPTAPWLLFDSHLDTVGTDMMTVAPLGQADDELIYGRGACDTKGTGATMLWALKAACHEASLEQPTGILFSVGEEHAQTGAKSFIERDLPTWNERYGSPLGGLIIGEPTNMQIVAATNGYIRIRVQTRGIATHSSRPVRGRNAINDMASVLLAIEQDLALSIYQRQVDTPSLTGGGSVSVNKISGGSQMNVTPELCEIGVDRRITPGESPDSAFEELCQLVYQLRRQREGIHCEVTAIDSAPPFSPDANGTLVDWAASVLESASIATQVKGEPYTTNANHYASAGLPCIVLGPGDIALAHTHNESISLADLSQGVEGYQALMQSVLS